MCAEPPEPPRPTDRLAFGAGFYDVIDRDAESLDLRFEYRWGWRLWVLQPWAGAEITSDGAVYGIVGLHTDFELGPRWVFTPSAGAGFYDEGDGKDLGHALEFRTQVEFARRFAADTRLGFALSHISNSRLNRRNPGTEILTVYYSIPIGRQSSDRKQNPPPWNRLAAQKW